MKHRFSIRALLVLATCVACLLAFGATLAQADVYNSDKGGENQLTVDVANKESEYMRNVKLKMDLYRVGSAEKDPNYDAYNYKFESEFEDLNQNFNQQTITNEGWTDKAADAKKIAARDEVKPYVGDVPMGDTITGLPDGVYLVVIPDTQSGKYAFTFSPTLVILPSKIDARGAPVYTSDAGSWTNIVNAVFLDAKWTMKELKGSLEIKKTVTHFVGDDATFTYHIAGEGYENYAAIHFSASKNGTQSTVVGGIPAGIVVTVTEVDDGAQYQVEGANVGTAPIVGNQTVTLDGGFEFTNAPNDSGKVGHGIENHFVFSEEKDDWQLAVREVNRTYEVL